MHFRYYIIHLNSTNAFQIIHHSPKRYKCYAFNIPQHIMYPNVIYVPSVGWAVVLLH